MTESSSPFPPSARLHNPAEFQRMLRDGKRSHGRYFRMHVLLTTDAATATGARLGITVSKRVDKRAVERNRIKRAVRESFRQIRAKLPAGDYLLVAKPEGRGVAGLTQDLEALWNRVASLNQPAAPGTMLGCVPNPSASSN